MLPCSPKCFRRTSAADMQVVSNTIGASSPSNAADALDLNSSGTSCAGKRSRQVRHEVLFLSQLLTSAASISPLPLKHQSIQLEAPCEEARMPRSWPLRRMSRWVGTPSWSPSENGKFFGKFLGNLLKHVHHLKITISWSHPNSCVVSHPHLTIMSFFNSHRTCYLVFYCHVKRLTCQILSSEQFTFFYMSPLYNHFPF